MVSIVGQYFEANELNICLKIYFEIVGAQIIKGSKTCPNQNSMKTVEAQVTNISNFFDLLNSLVSQGTLNFSDLDESIKTKLDTGCPHLTEILKSIDQLNSSEAIKQSILGNDEMETIIGEIELILADQYFQHLIEN